LTRLIDDLPVPEAPASRTYVKAVRYLLHGQPDQAAFEAPDPLLTGDPDASDLWVRVVRACHRLQGTSWRVLSLPQELTDVLAPGALRTLGVARIGKDSALTELERVDPGALDWVLLLDALAGAGAPTGRLKDRLASSPWLPSPEGAGRVRPR